MQSSWMLSSLSPIFCLNSGNISNSVNVFLFLADVYVWKVEGTFRVRTPPVLLGYAYDSRGTQADASMEAATQHSTENTYLTLFVTIEPQLAAPEPFREKVCNEHYAFLLDRFLVVYHWVP